MAQAEVEVAVLTRIQGVRVHLADMAEERSGFDAFSVVRELPVSVPGSGGEANANGRLEICPVRKKETASPPGSNVRGQALARVTKGKPGWNRPSTNKPGKKAGKKPGKKKPGIHPALPRSSGAQERTRTSTELPAST
jgi:hypothetical protein